MWSVEYALINLFVNTAYVFIAKSFNSDPKFSRKSFSWQLKELLLKLWVGIEETSL